MQQELSQGRVGSEAGSGAVWHTRGGHQEQIYCLDQWVRTYRIIVSLNLSQERLQAEAKAFTPFLSSAVTCQEKTH